MRGRREDKGVGKRPGEDEKKRGGGERGLARVHIENPKICQRKGAWELYCAMQIPACAFCA